MSDEIESAFEGTPDEARDWFAHIVATEGLRIAYETAVSICRDPKAAAPAKATAITAILRAAGAFDRKEEGSDIEPHSMTGKQLEREIARLKKRSVVLAPGGRGGRNGGGVFG